MYQKLIHSKRRCMLTAIRNSDRKKVFAKYSQKGSDTYHCPDCKGVVLLNQGLKKDPYFRHKTLQNCENEGETEEHRKIKLDIYEHIKNKWGAGLKLIDVEYRIESLLRADVYFETPRSKVAIEVQASSLTVSEVYRRTTLYRKMGIYVLWVLPFDYERFYRYHSERMNAVIPEPYPAGWYLKDSVKFKEYEIGIAKLTFNYLAFWDLSHKKSESFYVLKLTDAFSEDSQFYDVDWGHEVYYSGKKLKTVKSIRSFFNRDLDQFKAEKLKEFTSGKSYTIPERWALVFRKKTHEE